MLELALALPRQLLAYVRFIVPQLPLSASCRSIHSTIVRFQPRTQIARLTNIPFIAVLCIQHINVVHRPSKAIECGASTACTHTVSGSISLPSPGFFSPFPHGTGSLSVGRSYLALEDGPPMFRQGFTCPALLIIIHGALSCTGLSPSMADLSRSFH